jgi:hypothetical protein
MGGVVNFKLPAIPVFVKKGEFPYFRQLVFKDAYGRELKNVVSAHTDQYVVTYIKDNGIRCTTTGIHTCYREGAVCKTDAQLVSEEKKLQYYYGVIT